jgi:hypothetical protein
MRYGSIQCCKIIGFDAVNLREKIEFGDFKLSRSSFEFLRIHI